MAYIPTIWSERLGTGLNKYTKTNETSTTVELTNTPTSITQAGTPFSVAAMNNIENALDDVFNNSVTLEGNKTITGDVISNSALVCNNTGTLELNSPAIPAGGIRFSKGSFSSTNRRIIIAPTGEETGVGNAGRDLQVVLYDDNGANSKVAMFMERSTGNIDLNYDLTVGGEIFTNTGTIDNIFRVSNSFNSLTTEDTVFDFFSTTTGLGTRACIGFFGDTPICIFTYASSPDRIQFRDGAGTIVKEVNNGDATAIGSSMQIFVFMSS